jgi:hypothetical protein
MNGPSTPKRHEGKSALGGGGVLPPPSKAAIPPPPKVAITADQKVKQATTPRKAGLVVPPPPTAGPTAAQKKAQADAKQKAEQNARGVSTTATNTLDNAPSLPSPRSDEHLRHSSMDAFNALLSMASEFKGGDKKLHELQLEVHHATYDVVRVNKYQQRRRFAMKFLLRGASPKIEFATPSQGGRSMSSFSGTSGGDPEKIYELSAFARFVLSSADPNQLRLCFKEDKHPERLLVFRDGSERELFCYGASLLEKSIDMVSDCEEIMEDGSVKYEVQLINQAGVRKTRALVVNDKLRCIVRHQGKDVKDGDVKDAFHVNEISIERWNSDKKKATIWYEADHDVVRNANVSVFILKDMKKGASNLKQLNVEFPSTSARERFVGHVLALQHLDKGVKVFEDLSVFVGTWNVGDKSPPKNLADLTHWLGPAGEHDVYAIGFQENSKMAQWTKAFSAFLSAEKRAPQLSRHMNAFRNLRDHRSQSTEVNSFHGDLADRTTLPGSRGGGGGGGTAAAHLRGKSSGAMLRSTKSAQVTRNLVCVCVCV